MNETRNDPKPSVDGMISKPVCDLLIHLHLDKPKAKLQTITLNAILLMGTD